MSLFSVLFENSSKTSIIFIKLFSLYKIISSGNSSLGFINKISGYSIRLLLNSLKSLISIILKEFSEYEL